MPARTDAFRNFDGLARQRWGTAAQPETMPMDAWRDGEQIVVQFDLPGVDLYSVELDMPRHVLTVRAERRRAGGDDTEMIAAERPRGVLRRQVILAGTPDTERVQARYSAGVLTVRIAVAEAARPGKIAITASSRDADRAELAG